MRFRIWEERRPQGVVAGCPDGHVIAERGEIVVVLVARDWNEALRAMAMAAQLPKEEP